MDQNHINMKIKKISDVLIYPKNVNTEDRDTYDWYDFSGGYEIDNHSINEWMQDCLDGVREDLLLGVDKASYYVRSGNTMVTLFAYKQQNGTYNLDYTVTNNYMSAGIDEYDPLEDVEFVQVAGEIAAGDKTVGEINGG
jgi:hypothetical protein